MPTTDDTTPDEKKNAKRIAATRKRIERWFKTASQLTSADNPLTVPYDTFLGEARDAARFVRTYWTPTDERPGLERLQKRLPRATADELDELGHAVRHAHAELTLAISPDAAHLDHRERARELIAELGRALEYTLDDGVDDDDDRRFESVRAYHAKNLNATQLPIVAQDLLNHALLAERVTARLIDDDEGFDAANIDEALALAQTLADHNAPAAPTSDDVGNDNDAVAEKRALRNKLLHLMVERVGKVRKAARRVFGDRPEILREVTSAHERARRAARRAAEKEGTTEKATPDAPNTRVA